MNPTEHRTHRPKQLALALAIGLGLAAGTALAAPANDDFANAIDLTGAGTGQTGTVTSGDQTGTNSVDATVEAGEPAIFTATKTVWFKWTSPSDGEFTFDTTGSTNAGTTEWDSMIGIYTGASVGALTPLGDTPKDTAFQESMTITVTPGTTYYIQLAGFEDEEAANILLTWDFVAVVYQADIESFGPGAVIDPVVANAADIAWTVPFGTNLATLAPTFTLSFGATCTADGNPVVSGDPVDFSGGPVDYVVTSQDVTIVNTYTVTVTIATSLQWNVAGGGDWDTSTANWLPLPAGPATTFADGDQVTFDNAAGGTITVLGRTPFTTVVNSTGDYTFASGVSGTGDASILGGTLTKTGSGTLSLGDADLNTGNVYSNSFSSVAFNGGTLRYGNKDALGSGTVTIADGTTLIKFGQEGNASSVGLPNDIVLNGNVSMFMDFSATKDQYFNGTISGTGSITVTGSSRSVTMGGPNTYSGGSIIDGATLRGGLQNDDSFGTGPVTLNSNGRLLIFRGNHANALIVNGGKLYGDNGFNDSTWSGPITLNADLTVQPQWNLTISGDISGTGGLIIKRDFNARTVILTGANTYSGDTTVEDSTLRVTGTSIPDTGKLIIDGGKVEPIGTETVNNLLLGSALQQPGTYGATGSGADTIDDTRFTGTAGVINVLSGVPEDEADILGFGLPGAPAVITGNAIAWTVPTGTDVTNLAPDFDLSFGAVATPVSGTARDFTTPQTYSVDSGDGSITGNVYTVTVTAGTVPDTYTWDSGVAGDWSDSTKWTTDLATNAAPGFYGGSDYTLNFTAGGTYTTTHDLGAGFQLNQLNFSASATLDSEKAVVFTADGGTLPQLNQNSGSAAFIDLPIELAADTTFGGTGGGLVEMKNNPITGTGSLTMNGLGTLTLRDPNNLSTYSGGTIINSGTLRVDYRGNDDFTTDTVLGTGPVTLNGGTLYLFRVNPTNTLTAAGGMILSENGFGNNWSGPIILNADTTVQCQFILRANGDISGTGGIVKSGNDRLWLNGTNTYTGDTTVNAGTLRTTGSSIVDTGKLVIDGGKVEPVGTETVGSLFFGGTEQAAGTTYGATGSGAAIIDDARFSGTAGMIMVVAPSSPFETWAGGTGPGLGFDEDFNSDGVDNGVAFLLGAVGPSEDANDRLPTATEDGSGNLVMQFNCLPSAGRGTAQLRVAHSNTLASWTATVDQVPDADDAVADNNVTFVVVAGPVGPPALNSVTATIDGTAAAGGKLFGRLEATE